MFAGQTYRVGTLFYCSYNPFNFLIYAFILFQISGASIEITDSKSSRGDRMALVSGTPDQKHAAENLIQAFIMAT